MATGEEPRDTVVVDATAKTAAAPTAAAATEPVTTVAVEQKIDANAFLVTVDQLDTEYFKNTRDHMVEDRVSEYRVSLKDQGQIQPIAGVKISTGKIAVFAGYTRTEAFWRNVCQALIDKWNKDNELSSTHENFLIVGNPLHRKMVIAAYPDLFNKEKAKAHNLVKVSLDPEVTSPAKARMKSFIENYQRQDMSLANVFDQIEKMISEDGQTGQQVGRILKRSASQISQYRRASRVEKFLREFLVTPEAGETIDESDLAKLKEQVNVLMNEYSRRMSIAKGEKDYEVAISFSHIREFSTYAAPPARESASDENAWKCPMTRVQMLSLVCYLVGADPQKLVLRPNVPPMTYGVFLSHMKDYLETTKAIREGKVAAPEAAAATEEGTPADLATQQAANAEANADAKIAPAPGTPVAAATEAATAAAPVSTGNAAATDKDSEALANALVGGSAADGTEEDIEEPLVEEPTDGETKRKVQTAPIVAAKLKEVNTILNAVNNFVAQAGEPEDVELTPHLGALAGALQAAQFGYDMLGMDKLAKGMQKSSTVFIEDLETYVVALEEYCEKAGKKAKLPAFTLERPTPVLPEDLQQPVGKKDNTLTASDITGSDDADDLNDLDDPSEDDLREIEDLAGDDGE